MKLLVKKLLPFLILIVVVVGCGEIKENNDAWEGRSRAVDVLNEQFNLRDRVREAAGLRTYDCRFQFRIQYSEQSTLIARLCESSPRVANISDILTPQNIALIKGAKFEKVVLYDRHEKEILGSEAVR